MSPSDLQERCINAIRFLSADAVQQAKSGHPGLPMGAAAFLYTLWTRHLRFNPKNPKWPNRDRFVLSGGHGSAVLYSLLHLTGYDLPLDQIKQFRQWGSITPGHPEYGLTPGVEATTGPLGQGFANGVGMAIAEAHLAAEFNLPDIRPVDHFTYALVTDGDLMEGIASEAASLAGHLKLGKLIYLYDDNHVSIDGSTDLSFSEDRALRFDAYGWHTQIVLDGNNVETVDIALNAAKADPRPSLILCRTHIGFGLPTKQDTAKAHGEPPGDEELDGAKKKLGWPVSPRFLIPDDVQAFFREAVTRGARIESAWNDKLAAYRVAEPQKGAELERRLAGDLPKGWDENLTPFPADAKGMATRVASGKALNLFAERLPELVGGSADLTPSNNTTIANTRDFNKDNPAGRYLHFGVREHGMGGIVNGMAYHGGLIPFGGTFMVFSDYMRGAVRLSALSHIGSIWIYTHDSIGLGEDGPTHQPVEHLAALRAIPNMLVLRPADANEALVAWRIAIARRDGPTALILTRQNLPTLDRQIYASADNTARGAYVLADLGKKGKPQIILMASGSEVKLIVEAGQKLAARGTRVRLVSVPSWELFQAQKKSYRESVLPPQVTARLSVEAGVGQGWERWVGDAGEIISLEHFGASAPGEIVMQELGFNVENVLRRAKALLK